MRTRRDGTSMYIPTWYGHLSNQNASTRQIYPSNKPSKTNLRAVQAEIGLHR